MPVNARLANASRQATLRRFYYIAANPSSVVSPQQFFDAGFTPATPRLVNTAQITLQQGPTSGNGGGPVPSQQPKGGQSSSQQPPTSTLVLPLPMGGASNAAGSSASSRTNGNVGPGGAVGGLLVPQPGNYTPPTFFPSILASSEKSQTRSTFRLESGAYGIPKTRPATNQRVSDPSSSTSAPPISSPSPSSSSTSESPLLSCQIGEDSYFIRSVSIPHSLPYEIYFMCLGGLSLERSWCCRWCGGLGHSTWREQRLVLAAAHASLLT